MDNKLTIGILIGVVLGVLLTSTVVALGGSLNPSVGPTGAGSQMYTLEQIWQRLNNGAAGTKMSTFTEPGSGPTSTTMYTLNDIMAAAPAVDATNGATTADVISGKTFWGLTSGAWGLKTGAFSITGQRATLYSIPLGISKVLDENDSDKIDNGPDKELADLAQLLNPGSSDTLPAMIGVPSGYRYSTDGLTIEEANMAYPVSISTLIGTPKYDPYTGLPLTASHSYPSSWVSSCSSDYCFNTNAPIALRLRSLRSQLDSTGAFSVTGLRATNSSGSSKILDGTNSDQAPGNDPDTESKDVRQLLKSGSTDMLPNIIGVPSGFKYSKGSLQPSVELPYPASISTLLGNPTYDPYTGLPLTASHSYISSWVSTSYGVYYFNTNAPIALRLRSVMSELEMWRQH
jgi:hypothetical protein